MICRSAPQKGIQRRSLSYGLPVVDDEYLKHFCVTCEENEMRFAVVPRVITRSEEGSK